MDPTTLPPRDLVMKGGITSGVVYPGAARELAKHYRFRMVGGSSAGAIAAAVCAAAEYGRQRKQGSGMEQLERITDDLGTEGFLLSLFQPAPDTRELWEIIMALVERVQAERKEADAELDVPAAATAGVSAAAPPIAKLSTPRRARLGVRLGVRAALMALRRAPPALLLFALALAVVGGALVAVAVAGSPGVLTWVVLAALAGVVLGGAFAGSAAWALWRLLKGVAKALPQSHYGFCPGASQDGSQALVEWLHQNIQDAAGLDRDGVPLTFAELERQGIALAMTTTDLSYARPVPVPLPDESYLFDPRIWVTRFPRPVVAHMIAVAKGLPPGSEPAPEDWEHTHYLPGKELPVLVGVRLSLSFPLLLSAMPLHAYWTMLETPERVNLFSDGGICSNFPIHFFDAWFPETPTFGLDLVDLPGYESGADASEPRVGDPAQPAPPRWSQVNSLGEFLGQVKDAMQNWRDALQSELPGFRDRVCEVPLGKGQGGLNLRMTSTQIDALVEQGERAANVLHEQFDWERHRFIRYLTLMHMLQENLRALGGQASFPSFAATLAGGIPKGDPFAEGHDAAWSGPARAQTEELLRLAERWGPDGDVDFSRQPLPDPSPEIRVVPRG